MSIQNNKKKTTKNHGNVLLWCNIMRICSVHIPEELSGFKIITAQNTEKNYLTCLRSYSFPFVEWLGVILHVSVYMYLDYVETLINL